MSDVLAALVAEIGVVRRSPWLTIDQSMINRFADATLDHQFIHVDPERAALTPFGGTIAHGFLTLSLLPHLVGTIERPAMPAVRMGVNYGLDRVRFLAPVRAGSRVRAAAGLAAIEERAPGEFTQTLDVVVEVEGQAKPALAATWLTRFYV